MAMKSINIFKKTALIISYLFIVNTASAEHDNSVNIAVSAPIDTESAAKGGDIATNAVFRIICVKQDSQGTGFLHKSGNIITAAHVVKNCDEPTIQLINGSLISSKVTATDADLDLAIVAPTFPIDATPLILSSKTDIKIGAQVSTWGFPGGYIGLSPMLSVGYLSGMQGTRLSDGKVIRQWVVNAALWWPTPSNRNRRGDWCRFEQIGPDLSNSDDSTKRPPRSEKRFDV